MDTTLYFCRICLGKNDLENIFKRSDVPICEKIVYCASVQISRDDRFPKMICNRCLHYLDIAYIFKTVCLATDKKLRSFHFKEKEQVVNEIEYEANNRSIHDLKIDKFLDKQGLQEKNNVLFEDVVAHKKNEENVADKLMLTDVSIIAEERYGSINLDKSVSNNCQLQKSNSAYVEKCKVSDNSLMLKFNNEEDEKINSEDMNGNLEKIMPKDNTKVGRHIAKKISGKFPQKLPLKIANDRKKQIVMKSNVILNDVSLGNKCQDIIQNFEDILEIDVPAVGFEETVVTHNDAFPFMQTSTSDEQETKNADTSVLKVVSEDEEKESKVKLKTNSRTLNQGNRKINVFNDNNNKISRIKKKSQTKQVSEMCVKKIGNRFKCDVCSKSFLFRSHLNRHLNMHSGIKKYNCEYCEQKFINSYNLSVHVLKHTGQFPLKCALCDKGFPNPSLLKRHKTSHTGEANFKCRYCSVKFTQSSSLRLHEKMHLHRPSYHCDICYKVFSYTNSLAAHKKLHFCDKQYTCDTCLTTFSRKSSLIRHMEGHHKSKRFKCKVCGIYFCSKNSYFSHVKTHYKYKCDVCGEGFQYKTALKSHSKNHK